MRRLMPPQSRGIPHAALALCAILWPAVPARADNPPNFMFFTSATPIPMQLHLDNIVPDPGVTWTPNVPLKGKGDLHLKLGDADVLNAQGVPFAGVVADANGQVQTTKTGYQFTKDIPWSNVMGAGTDITLKAPFTILVDVAAKRVSITDRAQATLPFSSGNGPAQCTLPNLNVTLDAATGCSLDTDVTLTQGLPPGLSLAGFTIQLTSPHLHVQQPGSPILALKAQTVTVKTPIPNILTKQPLTLTGTGFQVDETGLPSFQSLQLAELPATPVQLASARLVHVAAFAPQPQVLELNQPMDFGFEVLSVDNARMTKGQFDPGFKVHGNLLLPSSMTDGKGGRAKVPGVTLQPFDPKNLFAISNQGFTAVWTPLGPSMPFSLTVKQFELGVTGLHNITGSVQLPSGASGITTKDGKPASVDVQNFTIDSTGVFGTAGISNGSLDTLTFPVDNINGSLSFDHNALLGGSLGGTVNIGPVGSVGVVVGLTRSGVSVDVVPSDSLTWKDFGFQFKVVSGGVHLESGGVYQFLITGSLQLPAIPPVMESALELDFKDLGVDRSGKFSADEISLAKPCEMDLGIMSAHIDRFTYRPSDSVIKLDGSVKLPDDLPIKAEVGFNGLEIRPGPKIAVNDIDVDAGILGAGHVHAHLVFNGDDKTWQANHLKNVMAGDAQLNIDALMGAGINARFLIAKGDPDGRSVWLVAAGLDLPPPGIQFPPPIPLAFMGFSGGFGHNVKLAAGDKGKLESYAYAPGNELLQAGCSIADTTQTMFWGDFTLTIGFPRFSLDLQGDVALQTPRTNPHPDWASLDRHGHADINWDGPSDTFRASGTVDYAFPTRGAKLFDAHGSLDLLISPDEGHLFVGWPMDQNPIQVTVWPSITAKGGLGLTLYNPQHEHRLDAGFDVSERFGVLKGEIAGTLGSAVDDHGHFTIDISGKASGEVDFLIAHVGASAALDIDIGGSLPIPDGLAIGGEFSVDVGVGPFSKTLDTGHVTLLHVGSK